MSSPENQDNCSADTRPYDKAARWALILPLLSGLLWLGLGGTLALIHSIQSHTPGFFSQCEWFTFGRMQAAAETALLLGWAGNGGIAVALWVLGRLGGVAPRGLGLAAVGTILWNLGATAATAGILAGDATGHSLIQAPGYVYPVLLVASAAMGVSGVLSWADRQQAPTFASQWYATAALFTLPWILSVALTYLYLSPERGVASVVAATWVGENFVSLWLSPLLLAVLYYLVPRLTGREIPVYSASLGGFWALVFFGAFATTRGLSGGPFPVWIPSLGIAASIVLVIHFLIVGLNLRGIFSAAGSSAAARFLALSLVCYVLGGIWDLASSLRFVARWTQFTYVAEARSALFLYGAFTPAVLGAIYFLMPRLTGKAWASDVLITQHFRTSFLSVLFSTGGLLVAGVIQSVLLADKEASFASMADPLKSWLLYSSAGVGLVLLGAVFLVVNLVFQLKPDCSCLCCDSADNTSAKAS